MFFKKIPLSENVDLNLLNQEKKDIKDQDLELNIKEDSEFALDDETIITIEDFTEVEDELITNTKTNTKTNNIEQRLVFKKIPLSENVDLDLLNQEKKNIKDQDLELNIKEDSEFALDDEIIVTVKDFTEVEDESITLNSERDDFTPQIISNNTIENNNYEDNHQLISDYNDIEVQNHEINIQNINNSFHQNYSSITYLVTQNRDGEIREFEFNNSDTDSEQPASLDIISEETESSQTVVPIAIEEINVVEILADEQEYDEEKQVITAIGNVEMRFAEAVLTSDRLQVNLNTKIAVAEDNVGLRRGDQVLRGDRFEYFFVQDQGTIKNARGEVYQPTLGRDTGSGLPSQDHLSNLSPYPISDRIFAQQPIENVRRAQGFQFVIGSGQDISLVDGSASESRGQINRYRFEADEVEFNSEGWDAKNIRLTNDPFSPPEFEVRADTAHFEEVEPQVSVLTTTNSRVVFDQGLSLPIFQDRLVFDNRPQDPALISIGIDGEERGGIFIERSFNIINTNKAYFTVTPQYYIQRAIFPDLLNLSDNDDEDSGGVLSPSVFGLKLDSGVNFDQRTDFTGKATFTSLDFDEIEDETEANLRLLHKIGDLQAPHNLSLEYNYRDRLFNGSLGFQRVQSSFGLLISSPRITLGDTGIRLNYQGSIQNINADTDRSDLLSVNRENNRVNLTRYQAATSLSKGFSLWRGDSLPATPTEGLKYTPSPVVPHIRLNTGITGVSSLYSNGDTQQSLRGRVGFSGQFGNFSRPFFDYTGFNINYSQAVRGDESPFLFDRIADRRILSLGIVQQIYGPFRFGYRTSLNLDTNEQISEDYTLEYSRRSYNISLRYNPVVQLGAITFRLNDFNWRGSADPFDGDTVGDINDGVRW